jgi:hypothetical protein
MRTLTDCCAEPIIVARLHVRTAAWEAWAWPQTADLQWCYRAICVSYALALVVGSIHEIKQGWRGDN